MGSLLVPEEAPLVEQRTAKILPKTVMPRSRVLGDSPSATHLSHYNGRLKYPRLRLSVREYGNLSRQVGKPEASPIWTGVASGQPRERADTSRERSPRPGDRVSYSRCLTPAEISGGSRKSTPHLGESGRNQQWTAVKGSATFGTNLLWG